MLVVTAMQAVLELVEGAWVRAAFWALFAGWWAWRAARAPAEDRQRAQARERWTPARIREATAGIEGHVPAVKALREADPALSLVDADRLVKAARHT